MGFSAELGQEDPPAPKSFLSPGIPEEERKHPIRTTAYLAWAAG